MGKELDKMNVASPAFASHGTIPEKYTCEGENVAPPLSISHIPEGAKSLAIIVDDPDAPRGVFVHWVAWNIDPASSILEEGFHSPGKGSNDFGKMEYKGPCPPPGKPHRYFFHVYALDAMLNIPNGSAKKELVAAMQGHILAQGELMGTFER